MIVPILAACGSDSGTKTLGTTIDDSGSTTTQGSSATTTKGPTTTGVPGSPVTNADGTPVTQPDGTPVTHPHASPVTHADGSPVTTAAPPPVNTGSPAVPCPAPTTPGFSNVVARDVSCDGVLGALPEIKPLLADSFTFRDYRCGRDSGTATNGRWSCKSGTNIEFAFDWRA